MSICLNNMKYDDCRSENEMDLDEINSDKFKDLHCTKCSDWLKVDYIPFNERVDGIQLSIDKLPMLICSNCGETYFPLKTRIQLRKIVEEAKTLGVDIFRGTRNDPIGNKKFDFCKNVDFDYDSTDYTTIPALYRSFNKGALTPVFFKKEVLQKFSSDPTYTLQQGSNTYGTIYHPYGSISYGITRNDKVICWLCDLDELPEEEQKYFASFNIPSDHDIASEFYAAQIQVQWGSHSNENQLFENIKLTNKKCKENFGYVIFKETDPQKLQKITRPIFWDEDNVQLVVNSLNKTCIESINQDVLKSDISKKDLEFNLKGLRGLKLLNKYLTINFPQLNTNQIMKPFYVMYDFRKILSHDTGSDAKKILKSCYKRMKVLPKKGFEGLYDSIVLESTKSLDEIINYEFEKKE